jgi:hypothetical protein
MLLTLDRKNLVINGIWNPFILIPQWLAANGILSTSIPLEQIPVQFQPLKRTFGFKIAEIQFEIQESRILLETTTNGNCGGVGKAILDTLSHTPVTAIGANHFFNCEFASLPETVRDALNFKSDFNGSSTWTLMKTTAHGSRQITVRHELPNPAAEISVNHHQNVTTAKAASEVAAHWAELLIESKSLLSDILNAK